MRQFDSNFCHKRKKLNSTMADLDVPKDDCDSKLNVVLVDQKILPKKNFFKKSPFV